VTWAASFTQQTAKTEHLEFILEAQQAQVNGGSCSGGERNVAVTVFPASPATALQRHIV
jgi:hypothetical protein